MEIARQVNDKLAKIDLYFLKLADAMITWLGMRLVLLLKTLPKFPMLLQTKYLIVICALCVFAVFFTFGFI